MLCAPFRLLPGQREGLPGQLQVFDAHEGARESWLTSQALEVRLSMSVLYIIEEGGGLSSRRPTILRIQLHREVGLGAEQDEIGGWGYTNTI